jgi:pyrrolidone-carboxylate peptidase
MMHDITAFSFKENISEKVLDNILTKSKYYLVADEKQIMLFIKNLLLHPPSFILGLGAYSGRDNNKLRIETICSNKFRNQVKGAEYEIIDINKFIEPLNNSKLSKGMGNSYCNLISYNIMRIIKDNNIKTHYAFIHIPKSFNIKVATDEINQMLNATFYKNGSNIMQVSK